MNPRTHDPAWVGMTYWLEGLDSGPLESLMRYQVCGHSFALADGWTSWLNPKDFLLAVW